MEKPDEQAKEACDELGRAIDHIGDAVIKLIHAERERCARVVETNHSFMCGENARDMMEAARELANIIRSGK
jgi:hypothetical protein